MRLLLAILSSLPVSACAATVTIDCGGAADQYFTGGTVYTIPSLPATPPGSTDSTLRYGQSFTYRIPAAGPQVLTLRFVEPTVSTPRARLFSVTLASQVVINYLDLAMEAGLLNLLSRSMLAFPSDGFIVLTFTAAVRYAVVSAIELTPLAEYLKLPDLSVLPPGASLLYSSDK